MRNKSEFSELTIKMDGQVHTNDRLFTQHESNYTVLNQQTQ